MQLSKCTLVLGVGTLKDVGKQDRHTVGNSKVLRLHGLKEHSDFLTFNLKKSKHSPGLRIQSSLPVT